MSKTEAIATRSSVALTTAPPVMVPPAQIFSNLVGHPANQHRRFAALFRYLCWQVSKRLSGRPWDIPYHGLTLRCHSDSNSASGAVYFDGLPDYREMLFIKRYLRPGDSFLDVGANVGVYSLLAAALVGAAGTVHAFEPGEMAANRLAENIALNRLGYVHLHRVGLSDRSGAAVWDQGNDDCEASLAAVAQLPQGATLPSVECVTLDEFLPAANFAMAKLDIEGAEPLAIRGARKHLASGNPPVLQIEMDGYSKKHGIATDAFIAELADYGYDVGIYDPNRNTIDFTDRPWELGVLNVLAINKARQEEVWARLRG